MQEPEDSGSESDGSSVVSLGVFLATASWFVGDGVADGLGVLVFASIVGVAVGAGMGVGEGGIGVAVGGIAVFVAVGIGSWLKAKSTDLVPPGKKNTGARRSSD